MLWRVSTVNASISVHERTLSFMAYWLFKSEPNCYSYADLAAEPSGSTGWGGVRNFQARNMLRDQIKNGDQVLFYHSNADPPGIAGIARVVQEAHPDPTAFDPDDEHYDPKSARDNPTWYQVSIEAVREIEPPLSLSFLRGIPALVKMELLRKGSRLSIQPVTEDEWQTVLSLADQPRDA